MKKVLGRAHPLLLAATAVLLHANTVWADGSSNADDGFTVLSNTANTTHWGIGAGAGFSASPYLGYGAKYTPIPLFSFDDKWVHALGTTLDLKVGKWDNVSFTLRGLYAIGDGYKSSDAPIFSGMQKRDAAFWFGPALSWHSDYGILSGDVLTSGDKGQRADIDFGTPFKLGRFTVEPHVGAEWLGNKYVDYYYGVPASDARAGRNAYAGTATYEESIGTRVDYRLAPNQRLNLDIGVAHLGSGITDSPLVGKKITPKASISYLYEFQ